jgi:hypothetical protein
MSLFNKLFKRKTPHYDSTDIRVVDLDVGFVFDYDLSSWKVNKLFEYDWGDEYFTREFQITNGVDTKYLSVEDDDELVLSISDKIKVASVNTSLLKEVMEGKEPPQKIIYQGDNYHLVSKNPGYFHDVAKGDDAWEELISWEYESDDEQRVLNIEQWGEKEFEASAGVIIQEFEVMNILPAED